MPRMPTTKKVVSFVAKARASSQGAQVEVAGLAFVQVSPQQDDQPRVHTDMKMSLRE